MAYQLYLPQDWASDRARRKRAGVPAEIEFRTKGDIALDQIQQALAAGLPRGVVLADAAYGTEAAWRDQLTTWGLKYAVAVREHTRVWYGKHRPAPMPAASPRGGRPRTRLVIDQKHAPVTVIELAQALPARHWSHVTWRAGTNAVLRSRFTANLSGDKEQEYFSDGPAEEIINALATPGGQGSPQAHMTAKWDRGAVTPKSTLAHVGGADESVRFCGNQCALS